MRSESKIEMTGVQKSNGESVVLEIFASATFGLQPKFFGKSRFSETIKRKEKPRVERMRNVKRGVKPDPEWIRARQALVRQLKREVSVRLGPESEDLDLYRRRYERGLCRPWEVCDKNRLLAEIERADIVFGGDFHAWAQAQRAHLRILRSVSSDRPVILALECFARSAQKWLDQYLAGSISLEELRKRTNWERSWGFPWDHYKPLFELAKRRGFRLLALNEPYGSKLHADLEKREENSARVIRDAYYRYPGALIYVIFGDLHLAEMHLPRQVKKQINSKTPLRYLVIHMNSERIYFQLAKQGLELDVDVVRLSAKRYCVLNSPPWVQWQSYLLFLDQAERSEDAELESVEDEEDGFDATDQVVNLIRLAAKDLGLEFKINDLSVDCADENSDWRSIEKTLKPSERAVARLLLASGRSFFIPQTGRGYLARLTINHAASLAGQYIHARLSKRRRELWRMPGDFKALIWTETVAYFFSKLINHKRRSETFVDLKAEIAMVGPSDRDGEALKLALDQFMSELIWIRQRRRRPLRVRVRRRASYFEAARILGGIRGERLYMAYRSRKLSAREIVSLLKIDVAAPGFQSDYELILRKLGEDLSHSVPSKRERL